MTGVLLQKKYVGVWRSAAVLLTKNFTKIRK